MIRAGVKENKRLEHKLQTNQALETLDRLIFEGRVIPKLICKLRMNIY